MLSVKICVLGLVCELLGGLITMATPLLKIFGLSYPLYYIDAILMFVVVPIIHLSNDEVTKTIIIERGYCQALRHMIGFNVYITPEYATTS